MWGTGREKKSDRPDTFFLTDIFISILGMRKSNTERMSNLPNKLVAEIALKAGLFDTKADQTPLFTDQNNQWIFLSCALKECIHLPEWNLTYSGGLHPVNFIIEFRYLALFFAHYIFHLVKSPIRNWQYYSLGVERWEVSHCSVFMRRTGNNHSWHDHPVYPGT